MRHAAVMPVRFLVSLHRALLLVALTIALVATGFAHRVPTAQDEALAFALQNGFGLSDFCGDAPGKARHAGAGCEACQIAGSAGLPPLAGARIDLGLARPCAVVARLDVRAIPRVLDPAHRPQGPPVA